MRELAVYRANAAYMLGVEDEKRKEKSVSMKKNKRRNGAQQEIRFPIGRVWGSPHQANRRPARDAGSAFLTEKGIACSDCSISSRIEACFCIELSD